MKIFLIGMPASGKSTLGISLARELSLPFIDTDALIVAQEQQSVDTIFADKGEYYFRELEKKVLVQIIAGTDAVISTGGGLPCFHGNIEAINRHGTSIFLDVPLDQLVKRMAWGSTRGHMVHGKSLQEVRQFVETRYNDRKAIYSKAHIHVMHPDITLAMLREALNKHQIPDSK